MKTKSTNNVTSDFVKSALNVETEKAIGAFLDEQSCMANDWGNWLNCMSNNAEKQASQAKTPKARKQWQARQAAIERARVLVGATLAHAMSAIGAQVADVIDEEFKDPYAKAFSNELRDYEPATIPL